MKARSREQISYTMSRIRGKDTGIETALRRELRRRRLHYRKNVPHLPGKPDVAFASLKVAVFCDGEFWHGHDWTRRQADLKGNRAFWVAKIERNRARDRAVDAALREAGWRVLRFWGRKIERDVGKVADLVEHVLVAQLLRRWR